ncbi:DUF4007 family protein [Arenicellales bacterium IMCC57338]
MNFIESPRLAKFNGAHVAFGRHESFPLRYGWLTKGFEQVAKDPQALSRDDATVQLGVGRNMVHSIRYWLRATRMVEANKTGLLPTELGNKLFGSKGSDRYLEDEATIWLIHWLLASNPEQSTAWYWFFNHFHKPEFTSQEAIGALVQFCQAHVTSKQSFSKIKQDGAIVLRMYVQSKAAPRTPIEEALDSPLSTLRLTSYSPSTRRFQSRATVRADVPALVLGFAILEILDYQHIAAIPLDDLLQSRSGLPAIGSVFRLNETGLIAKLEEIVEMFPNEFELRETAGLQQFYRTGSMSGLKFLDHQYAAALRTAA